MNKPTELFIVPPLDPKLANDDSKPNAVTGSAIPVSGADIHWTILKRKTDPKTRTEVVIKLNGKDRHLFMTKPDEEEEEITHLFNAYDKRVFEDIFKKIQMKKL